VTTDTTDLGVGMAGHAFMGAVHSHAWRTVHHAFDTPLRPRRRVLCGRDRAATERAAARLGWEETVTDWRELVARDDVQLVDICTPGDTHAAIAIAALEAGKHVLCEKPLANTLAEAEAMAAAAERAAARGVRAMVAFNYRRVPALALARRLIAEGRLGAVRHVRAAYLQDWLVDEEFPLTWRLTRERAGSGALGDLGAHLVDLVQHVTGEPITGVSALTETFVRERPLPGGPAGAAGEVTVDDAAVFLARLGGGALATFEATRMATGRRNALRLEINGTEGSLAFDLETLDELHLYEAGEPTTAGFRRIHVTDPGHPYLEGWWPAGHNLGYEHSFTHEIRDLLHAVAEGTDPTPGFADGLRVQQVLAAVETSAADRSRWQTLPAPTAGVLA
jgi:predicted dehydrogenase